MRNNDQITGEADRLPGDNPGMSVEEIEREILQLRHPAAMDELDTWLKSRPPAIREVAEKFPRHQLFRIKENAPYRYTVAGSIVAPYSFVESASGEIEIRFTVLRSPIGHAGCVAEISPHWLEPITLDDLKEEVNADH